MDAVSHSASRSNVQTAAFHRQSPPLRSSSKNVLQDPFTGDVNSSPPSTPFNTRRRVKGKGPVHPALRQQSSDGGSAPFNSRHSHGLSWSSVTRDSVVDNLLMSLDGLSMQKGGLLDDFEVATEKDRQRQAPLYAMDRMGRARGHTHSSSLSSDHDRHGATASPSSKFSSPVYRSRRSNSSSNFAAHNTISEKVRLPKVTSGDMERAGKKNWGHNVAGHTREESDASSTDLGYTSIAEAGRLAWGGKSASMDHIYIDRGREDSILSRGRPVPSAFSTYDAASDAAPEPMVPAGPRKMQNPGATGPVYVNQAPKSSAIRKVTTQSDLRSASSPTIPQDIRDKASDFVRASSMRGSPIVPAVSERAPTKMSQQTSARNDVSTPARERPGFFKRVFGGSSRAIERPGSAQNSHEPIGNRKASEGSAVANVRTGPEAKQSAGEASHSTQPTQTLNKKPSNFFRRRKKSNSEQPPPLPAKDIPVARPKARESVSSLRKVMDPYISSEDSPANDISKGAKGDLSRSNTQDATTDDSDDLDMFHSGYTPPPDASMGQRDPLSRGANPAVPSKKENDSRVKVKVKKRRPDMSISSFSVHSNDNNSQNAMGDERPALPPAASGLDREFDQPKVSPLFDSAPSELADDRPVSRASTGDGIIASNGDDNHQLPHAQQPTPSPDEESWIVMRNQKANGEASASRSPGRLFLHPTESEDVVANTVITISPSFDNSAPNSAKSPHAKDAYSSALPSPATPSTRFHSAVSLPLVQVEGSDAPRQSIDEQSTHEASQLPDDNAEYRERARRIFEGDEEDVTQMEAASWLGEFKTLNTRTLHEYMQLFDFAGLSILATLRALCGKLILKGETQQFDRIITALSARWCACNPKHGFKAEDVVHTIFYSLILLNTDLHLADIGEKMSRNAYVKNTLPSVRRVVADAAPNAFDETVRPATNNQQRPSIPWAESAPSVPISPGLPPADPPQERTSVEIFRPQMTKRMSIRPGMFRTDSDGAGADSPNGTSSNTLVNSPWTGPKRGWEVEIELILKSFFNSIRTDPLPLLNMSASEPPPSERNLGVGSYGMKRSGSIASRAPSEAMSSRSKAGFRNLAMGFQNRNTRSRQRVYASSTVGSSRTSFDDGNSLWSPAQSSTWSRNSMVRTLASTSVGSLGYHLSPVDKEFKHSIGFANALSQAIIREEGGGMETDSITLKGELLEDESLALEGAPWAKEGLIKHKHHLEGPDRKAKERSWNDCFAVISKGKLTLFAFGTDTKSRTLHRPRNGRAASIAATKVGGGDWMENAEQLDHFVLRHTISSTLPKPGYSKTRPHVWALSLPTGAVHLFQVGTPEIAAEWTTTANYWSARLSKEPLQGGVSNIEYGWSDQVINTSLLERSHSTTPLPPSATRRPSQPGHMHSASSASMPRPSMQSSLRGSLDIGGSSRPKLPGDKIQITDWQQPSQSMMSSQMSEADQLRSLTTYVANVEEELETHNELKHAIELAYSPRHSNYNKAMSNWQRKSEYLLREIVKFRTYIDSIGTAQQTKEEIYSRRAERDTARIHAAGLNTIAKSSDDASVSGSSSVMTSDEDVMSNLTPRASHFPAAGAGAGA